MAQDGKTEKPTARRLRDARKEGQFARTPDAATWLGIAGGTALVPHGVDVLRTQVGGMLATLPGVAADPTPARALAAVAVLPVPVALRLLGGGLHTLVWSVTITGLLLALGDYAFQRRTVMKQLRMTPREIKDENRQTEGDPMVKGAIRARQMAMSRNRMLAAVANADVVLVNPTHYAVALRYEAGRGAPRVVAKGTDALAAKIRERAREHRVPIVEDKPLARLLHRVCEVDDEIPAELYAAVAKILAFVFSLRRPGSGVPRPGPSALPEMPTRTVLRVRRSRERREGRREVR